MNLKRLEQYRATKREIRELENRISRLQGQKVSDSVTGSSRSFPYTSHVIKLEGVDVDRVGRLWYRLRKRKNKLLRELEAIEEFVDAIADSDIRQIIQLRYLDGLSWMVVARKLYRYPCGDRARKRITRFFRKK